LVTSNEHEIQTLPGLSCGILNAFGLSERAKLEHLSLLSQNWTTNE